MTKITEEEKGIIVKKYLNCETLDKISEEMRVSKGSVFNTVKAWKSEIGEDIVEEIRRFKMHLNQSNISINECIIGFRITNLLKQFDVFDEFERDYFDSVDDNRQLSSSNPQFNNNTISPDLTDQQQQQQQIGKNYSSKQTNDKNDLYEFIGKIYQGCKNHDISPGDLVKWAKNLIEFAPRLDNKFDEIDNSSIVQDESQSPYKKQYSIPKVSELSTYIESEKRNYIMLKKEISALINHKHELKNQINKKTEQLNELGKKENFTLQYLKWYSDLHDALINNYNIDIKQVYGTFVKVIYDFKKYDFDPIKIINDYKNMESLREEYNRYKRYNDIAIDNRNNLVQQVASLENQAFLYDRKIKNIEKLQNMGFGVKEFEQLSNVLMHIASVNKINKDTSVQKFLMDVASQYDCKLGFEATINLLNEEKRKIENEIPAYRVFISTKVAATQSMDYLQKNGVTAFDIIGIELLMKAFLSGQFVFYTTKSANNANPLGDKIKENNNTLRWQLFIDNLKYLKDLMAEITARRTELKTIDIQINRKLAEKQQIDNQLARSTSDLNGLTLQGIHLMDALNQFSARMTANKTTTKILPMVFVNFSSPKPKDSQVSESHDNDKSEDK